MKTPWTLDEIEDISLGWQHFQVLWPHRSYDSWEVKRRRVLGGTAGTRRAKNLSKLHFFDAVQALKKLTDFVELTARG